MKYRNISDKKFYTNLIYKKIIITMKNILDFTTFIINEEKSTKKEGKETLKASSYAYVPDPDKSSTWKLRIDDAEHTRAAVAALGKGFRGQKVQIPSKEKDAVISKVRKAYKKFYPEKVKEEGYPDALSV